MPWDPVAVHHGDRDEGVPEHGGGAGALQDEGVHKIGRPTGATMNNEDKWRERIVIDPNLHHGKPCIEGTRVAVAVIVANLAEMSIEELLKAYPQLTREDVNAALLYASKA